MKHEQPLAYSALAEDMIRERDYPITESVYNHFLSAFGDRSLIHVDDDHARAAGFAGRVMHGAILNGFLSHFVGMVFPGTYSLLLSVDLRFSQPSYLGEVLRIQGRIVQKVESQRVVVMHASIHNQTRGVAAASGRLQIKVLRP